MREELNAQRIIDFKQGDYARAGGVVDPLPEDAPQFVKDYHAYYKTDRGYHVRSLNSNDGWNRTSGLSLMNAKLLYSRNPSCSISHSRGKSSLTLLWGGCFQ